MTKTTDKVLPDTNQDLLTKPVVAHLATARPDGQLQSNPVWYEWDGTHLKISQTRSRQKIRNMQHDPHVALSIADSPTTDCCENSWLFLVSIISEACARYLAGVTRR